MPIANFLCTFQSPKAVAPFTRLCYKLPMRYPLISSWAAYVAILQGDTYKRREKLFTMHGQPFEFVMVKQQVALHILGYRLCLGSS